MKPTHDRARIAKLAAIVTGLLGVFLALATPLLPVNQTTAEVNWPQQDKLQSVLALSLINISEPTRLQRSSRIPSSA